MRGSFSITLVKIVVITSMLVRFTVRAASKKNGLKKVVAKVIIRSRREGKKVLIISLRTFRFRTTVIQMPSEGSVSFLKLRFHVFSLNRVMSCSCSTRRLFGNRSVVGLSNLPTVMLIEHT